MQKKMGNGCRIRWRGVEGNNTLCLPNGRRARCIDTIWKWEERGKKRKRWEWYNASFVVSWGGNDQTKSR